LTVPYRWVSHEDDEVSLEESLMVTLDVVLAGIGAGTAG
jgi:hypothetical protein